LATEAKEPVKAGSTASVRGHIWRASDSVNAFLQFYFVGPETRRNPPLFEDGSDAAGIKGS